MENLEEENRKLKELLKLAGKLALSANMVIESNSLNLSNNITIMKKELIEYNKGVFNFV